MSRFVKGIYALLFLALVLQPHFIQGHIFSIPAAYAQSIAIIVLLEIWYVIHFLHRREVEREQKKREQAEAELHFSSEKLNDSYRYIGSVNRQLALLPSVTSDLLGQYKKDKKMRRVIFEELLGTAVTTLAHASEGHLRFVRIANAETEEEFKYSLGEVRVQASCYDNKDLIRARKNSVRRIFPLNGVSVLPTSDREASVQCFFLFDVKGSTLKEQETTLQAIVDQAQLFYKYLYDQE
jgi:hypothetical protein